MATIEELETQIAEMKRELARQQKFADMQAISQLMGRYIFYMENGLVAEVWDELFSHEDPDVRVEIMDSGAYKGQEHVKRVWYTMGGRMDKSGRMITEEEEHEMSNTWSDDPQLLLTIMLTTPLIEVSPDGLHASGQWHLFGPHTNYVFDPDTLEKKHTAFWMVGKYANEFVKEHGEWKFKSLRPIGWLRTPYDKGWLRCPDCRKTPPPYWPPDEAPRSNAWSPEEAWRPDKWYPLPPEHIAYPEE
ncbi:MAG: nuclear transport factor 2 family protein [Oscillospiraceae bacterium]|nr:nuclear transport factor 2 family protein [Oscillospiraceae bacterium]